MNLLLSDIEFRLFKKYIEDKCGIEIPNDKAYFIESRLSGLMYEMQVSSFDELYYLIRNNQNAKASEKLIDAITTNETSWFRDKVPWSIIENNLLPRYVSEIRSGSKNKIRIWSAASSTGQEAYSTAMFIDSWLFRSGIRDITLKNFEIIGTDISTTAIELAKNGRYDAITIMRGMEAYYKEKYFTKDKTSWQLNDNIRNSVEFKYFNLQNSFFMLGKFDIVFCRNVLIYFSTAFKEEIFNKLYNTMTDDSIMFLGSSELYDEIERYFERIHAEIGTYYTKRR
jgi:chemotaxis protein methyltransferase CheR